MDKYIMYKCMESSNTSCNKCRIIASLSGGVETMKRHSETTKRHDKTTNDDEPMWSVTSRTRKTTSRRGKPTNRTVKMTGAFIMPNRPARDQWEYPRKMERHFSIKPGQPIAMALTIFYSFSEFP